MLGDVEIDAVECLILAIPEIDILDLELDALRAVVMPIPETKTLIECREQFSLFAKLSTGGFLPRPRAPRRFLGFMRGYEGNITEIRQARDDTVRQTTAW